MKKIYLLLTLLLCISSCNVVDTPKFQTSVNVTDEVNVSTNFLLGKWASEKKVVSGDQVYVEYYQIEFIDGETLRFSKTSPVDGFDEKFNYQFVDSSSLIVENARAKNGKWKINQLDNNLLICIWSENNCLVFVKKSYP